MAMQTGISWCDSTANLWIGCTKVSGACDHCYAEAEQANRRHRVVWGPHGDRSYCKQGWSDLRKWQRAAAANGGVDPVLGRRRVVFINSLSDFFDNHRSITWRAAAWDLFRGCTHLILILVTKRPQLIADMLPPFWNEIAGRIILMTTVEDQTEANRRIPALFAPFMRGGFKEPAVLGLSIEPMLGPVDLTNIKPPNSFHGDAHGSSAIWSDNAIGRPWVRWVIVGGESGPEARPVNPAWVRPVMAACSDWRIPFHLKQWGEWADMSTAGIVQDGPVTSRHGDVPDWMHRGVTYADGRKAKLRAHSFTDHSTDLVYRVGRAAAGHLLDGREYREMPHVG